LLVFTALLTVACAKSGQETAPHPGDAYVDRYSGSGNLIGVDMEMHGGTEPSSDVIDAPVESVWLTLPLVYERLGVPAELLDRRGQRIGNTRFNPRRIEGKRLSRYIECGYGVTSSNNADVYRVTMSLVTRISATERGATLVQTYIDASARPRDVSGNPVRCSTKQVLEKRIAELVQTTLERGIPRR
jgi:hypothetical protein